MPDLEPIYDEKIAPLMAQILEVAREHNLPFVANFQLNDLNIDDQGPLFCASAIVPAGCDPSIKRMYDTIVSGREGRDLLVIHYKEKGAS